MDESNYELAIDRSTPRLGSKPQISKTSVALRSCRICLSSVRDAACLSCGHQFCEECLVKYWHVKERPDHIVCPLCRARAFSVDFAKKEVLPSKEDFRKTFNTLENIPESEANSTPLQCLRISILMPAVYYALKWLRIPFTEILRFFHFRLRRS